MKKIKLIILFSLFLNAAIAQEGFLGEVKLFAGNFAPRGWALCQGQLLPIAQNQALFSILGTIYGGDGRTTFALPDLRGRVPVGTGNGPGLSPSIIGRKGGSETQTLTVLNLPPHSHTTQATIRVSDEQGTTDDPQGKYLSSTYDPISRRSFSEPKIYTDNYSNTNAVPSTMANDAVDVDVDNTGGGQSINIVQPYAVMNYIICIQGTFPSRS